MKSAGREPRDGTFGRPGPFLRAMATNVLALITRQLYIDLDADPTNPIFLAGTGRSGTTWVSDIINHRNEYRYIFEPFRPDRARLCRRFRNNQYLRPGERDNDLLQTAEAILSGRMRNAWADSHNRRFLCTKRLIKDIRANLLLKWIHTNFAGIRIVLLLRHPCAVAGSQIKWGWSVDLEEYLSQGQLMEDFLNPFRDEIGCPMDAFGKHVFAWCIQNYVPLRQFRDGEIHLAFYENFCVAPADEIGRMFSFLGVPFDDSVLAGLRMPSSTHRADSAIVTGADLIDGWRQYVTGQQTRRAMEILNLFGLSRVYSERSMPDVHGAYGVLNSDR